MTDHPKGFFQGTEMPTAGWWEALWPDPAGVLAKVGVRPGMNVIDLCSGVPKADFLAILHKDNCDFLEWLKHSTEPIQYYRLGLRRPCNGSEDLL
jgi:hypothetical protein